MNGALSLIPLWKCGSEIDHLWVTFLRAGGPGGRIRRAGRLRQPYIGDLRANGFAQAAACGGRLAFSPLSTAGRILRTRLGENPAAPIGHARAIFRFVREASARCRGIGACGCIVAPLRIGAFSLNFRGDAGKFAQAVVPVGYAVATTDRIGGGVAKGGALFAFPQRFAAIFFFTITIGSAIVGRGARLGMGDRRSRIGISGNIGDDDLGGGTMKEWRQDAPHNS